jgi:uncharacterized membrane protein YfcA
MFDITLLAIAAFVAGVVNTIAGGGTFFTFPALVFVGVPPVIANATSALAVLPGYLSGAIGFRAEIASFPRKDLIRLVAVSLIGGLAGAGLLLISSNAAFLVLVPFLLLAATLAFLFGQNFREWAKAKNMKITPQGPVGLVAVSVYGGYFNGGLGIVLLSLFSLWGMKDIHQMNGLKNALSFTLSAISVVAFAVAGLIAWSPAIVMMVAATLGGYVGAPVARAMPKSVLKLFIGAIGFGMSAVFFLRLWG